MLEATVRGDARAAVWGPSLDGLAPPRHQDRPRRVVVIPRWLIRLLAPALAAVGVSLGIVAVLIAFRDSLHLLGNWGYLGVAFGELANSALVLIPTPAPAYTFAMGSVLNPFALGTVGGVGAALGELFGYYLGVKGRQAIGSPRAMRRLKVLTSRWGSVALMAFAVSPLPFGPGGDMGRFGQLSGTEVPPPGDSRQGRQGHHGGIGRLLRLPVAGGNRQLTSYLKSPFPPEGKVKIGVNSITGGVEVKNKGKITGPAGGAAGRRDCRRYRRPAARAQARLRAALGHLSTRRGVVGRKPGTRSSPRSARCARASAPATGRVRNRVAPVLERMAARLGKYRNGYATNGHVEDNARRRRGERGRGAAEAVRAGGVSRSLPAHARGPAARPGGSFPLIVFGRSSTNSTSRGYL